MDAKINKNVYIRSNILYVQGSINGVFKRYSTNKKATKTNIRWVTDNYKQVLLQLNENKEKKQTLNLSTKFEEFAIQSLDINSINRKEATNKEYIYIYNKYIKNSFKNYHLNDIKKLILQNWINKLIKSGLSYGRVKFIKTILNNILNDAVENELISKNPLGYIRLKNWENKEEKIHPFSLDDIKAILNIATNQDKNILTTLFFTGMRTGECWGLKWSDIDFRNKTITIRRAIRHGVISTTKTNSSNRTITMLPVVESSLQNQKGFTYNYDSFVFLTRDKKHFNSSTTFSRNKWKNILKLAKLDYRYLYQTRHTFASMMISKGEDILWVSKMLGHTNANITLGFYSKYIEQETKKRAKFLEDFDSKNCTNTAQISYKIPKIS